MFARKEKGTRNAITPDQATAFIGGEALLKCSMKGEIIAEVVSVKTVKDNSLYFEATREGKRNAYSVDLGSIEILN
jgi:hypothetical protein